jgi:tRNA(fMet)-specific endonuclease VapC
MIIDTSVLIGAGRKRVRVVDMLRFFADESVAICSITASELLHGAHRTTNAAVRARRFASVESVIQRIPIAPFQLIEARRHAELWADLVSRGIMIGPHDLIIAATALARGESLATLNAREFARVPGLNLVKVDRFLIA